MSSYICPTHGVGPICQDCVNGIGRADGWTPAFGDNFVSMGSPPPSRAAQANAAAAWAGMAADHQPRVGRRDWEVPAAPQQPVMPYAPDTDGAARQAAYSAALIAGLIYWESTLRQQYRAAHPSAPDAEVNRYAARHTKIFFWTTFITTAIAIVVVIAVLSALLGSE